MLMYHHLRQGYEVLLPLHNHLSHTLPSPNYVMFENAPGMWQLSYPPCVDTRIPSGQRLWMFLSLFIPTNWWNMKTAKEEMLNKYLLNEWITPLSLYSWCSDTEAFILWSSCCDWCQDRRELWGLECLGAFHRGRKLLWVCDDEKGLLRKAELMAWAQARKQSGKDEYGMDRRQCGNWHDWQVTRIRLPELWKTWDFMK